jgi:hypothetical protein
MGNPLKRKVQQRQLNSGGTTVIVKVIDAVDELDCRCYLKILIDDRKVFSAMDGEPEDNNLSRNFNNCFGIEGLLEQAFRAGERGEHFKIVRETVDWEDI